MKEAAAAIPEACVTACASADRSCLGRWHRGSWKKAALDGHEPGPGGAAGALVLAWFKWKYFFFNANKS